MDLAVPLAAERQLRAMSLTQIIPRFGAIQSFLVVWALMVLRSLDADLLMREMVINTSQYAVLETVSSFLPIVLELYIYIYKIHVYSRVLTHVEESSRIVFQKRMISF